MKCMLCHKHSVELEAKVIPGSGSNRVNRDFTRPGSKPEGTPPGSGSKIFPRCLPRRGLALIFCRGFNPPVVGVDKNSEVDIPPRSGLIFCRSFNRAGVGV